MHFRVGSAFMQKADSNAFIQGNALADSSVCRYAPHCPRRCALAAHDLPVVIPVIRRIERLKGSKYEMIQRG